ncbi:AAA family ATPase [Pseudarthrobacter sp. PS3-L1]|uniref:ATP-binding protein n=1 Tax=Pseudarthrobacter sp. PS3-L1 TaxID=3046207 RepID=UPI0024BA4891|nr:AAA family ATPase [Pseudarthrobacter sp. PS3-L1]MDJ0319785.1 AAA family ATPase [Pseudarthrobacter sp. PS3-L1]
MSDPDDYEPTDLELLSHGINIEPTDPWDSPSYTTVKPERQHQMSVIKSLEISNFQRLTAAKIEPTGSLIVLAGQNANGKTSVLDAIETTLCGFNARNTKRPIKDGHGKASIDIALTDGTVVRRTFTPSGSTLSGTRPDGAKLKQSDLNAIISHLGVDASTFATSGDKEQLKTLLSVVDLPFVPSELDAKRKSIFDERTAVSRDMKRLEAQAAGFPAFPVDTTTDEVSVRDLLAEHGNATRQNNLVTAAHESTSSWTEEVERLRAKLAEAEESLAKAIDHASGAPALIDTDAIQERIDNAEQINATVRDYKSSQEVAAALTAARGNAEKLTEDLAAIDQTKRDGLAAVEMPIEGLSFDEEGVLYQGIPFSRASGAEQIIVSAAMIIATDPELRTMVIRNGNVLDKGSLQQLEEMLEDNNFLAFIEYVSDGEDHEYRMVDGELAA